MNPISKEEMAKTVSPYMAELYADDKVVIAIHKTYPILRAILEEGQRTRVNVANVGSIGAILLAVNFDLKLIQNFALRGESLTRAHAEKEAKKKSTK